MRFQVLLRILRRGIDIPSTATKGRHGVTVHYATTGRKQKCWSTSTRYVKQSIPRLPAQSDALSIDIYLEILSLVSEIFCLLTATLAAEGIDWVWISRVLF